jgi:hypothetical protein
MSKSQTRHLIPALLLLAAACGMQAGVVEAAGQAAGAPVVDLAAQPQLFLTSDRCIGCHNAVTSPEIGDISIGSHWHASMMANAARDPYWQAGVRREITVHPTASAAIQHECSACHMPMMRYHAKLAGAQGGVFANLPASLQQLPFGLLAVDGVSCTLCHQVTPEGFGEKRSFTAGFAIDAGLPAGQRSINGPFDVDAGRQQLMHSATFYTPQKAGHIQESEFCASCHTLYTHSLDERGEVVGELPEQVPYLEWKHSAYAGERSCQSCHMPEVPGKVRVTGVMGLEHENVSMHSFRGGNFLMPKILDRHRAELGVKALPGELARTSASAGENLATASAKLGLENVVVSGGTLRAEVLVENLAGHKLPTAYPSRRAWVHFTVTAGDSAVLFESGAFNADGSIAGNDNDADPAAYEPHYELISNAGEVQVYEPILGDPQGRVTTVLLSGVTYLKDNRILPAGFDKATAHEDIAVNGAALEDADFTGGTDRVRYEVKLDSGSGPLTVTAELWYQPIGYRWAHNLADINAMETNRFLAYYEEQAANSAALLARDTVVVE